MSRWERAVWSAIQIASVYLLGPYANWSGFRVSGMMVLSHDKPLKAFHGYRCKCYSAIVIKKGYQAFLGTGTMVVCLKHVGITDWARETLKMSLGSWSADALSTCPGNPSGTVAL